MDSFYGVTQGLVDVPDGGMGLTGGRFLDILLNEYETGEDECGIEDAAVGEEIWEEMWEDVSFMTEGSSCMEKYLSRGITISQRACSEDVWKRDNGSDPQDGNCRKRSKNSDGVDGKWLEVTGAGYDSDCSLQGGKECMPHTDSEYNNTLVHPENVSQYSSICVGEDSEDNLHSPVTYWTDENKTEIPLNTSKNDTQMEESTQHVSDMMKDTEFMLNLKKLISAVDKGNTNHKRGTYPLSLLSNRGVGSTAAAHVCEYNMMEHCTKKRFRRGLCEQHYTLLYRVYNRSGAASNTSLSCVRNIMDRESAIRNGASVEAYVANGYHLEKLGWISTKECVLNHCCGTIHVKARGLCKPHYQKMQRWLQKQKKMNLPSPACPTT